MKVVEQAERIVEPTARETTGRDRIAQVEELFGGLPEQSPALRALWNDVRDVLATRAQQAERTAQPDGKDRTDRWIRSHPDIERNVHQDRVADGAQSRQREHENHAAVDAPDLGL
jgi:hypothetical protein